jgi:hypothetical protein
MSTTTTSPAHASASVSLLAASAKFKAFAITFSISSPVIYCLVVYLNLPLFTYWPATGRFAWGYGPVTAADGPNMLWYGWTITTILIAAAVGMVAMTMPERVIRRIPLALVWILPILAIPFVVYSLMFWWKLAFKG